jgi:hypothetical protein
MSDTALEVRGLFAGYGRIEALHGIDLRVGKESWWRWSARTARARRRCCARCRGSSRPAPAA